MYRSRPAGAIVASASVAIALSAILILLVSGALGRSSIATPPASQPPSSAPSASPTQRPTPTAKPPVDFDAGVRIPLRTATGETKAVFVKDSTGMVIDAVSGVPREDVSVGPRRVVVEQVDANTLRVIWADTAINDDVSLSVSRAGGTLRISMIRRHLSPDVEIAHERIALLTFDTGVYATGVEASIRNSLDTED